MKYLEFLHITHILNQRLNVTPLLFGSLGLEHRLNISLNADDIDVLVPEKYINDNWPQLVEIMEEEGYILIDLEEHDFEKSNIHIAFAGIESLAPFAGVDISRIPVISDNGTQYYLLELSDYLKVYTASSKDGYRKDVKNKQDQQKIDLIKQALMNK